MNQAPVDEMSPIVLEPSTFDEDAAWQECREYVEKCGGLAHADGEPNWRAAFGADPGICSCPACHFNYWAWGRVQRCRQCGFEYPTDWWAMFSWGAQAFRGGIMRKSLSHDDRLDHSYYRYGFENPPEGDISKAAFKTLDWRTINLSPSLA